VDTASFLGFEESQETKKTERNTRLIVDLMIKMVLLI